jgi:hypothetical protein
MLAAADEPAAAAATKLLFTCLRQANYPPWCVPLRDAGVEGALAARLRQLLDAASAVPVECEGEEWYCDKLSVAQALASQLLICEGCAEAAVNAGLVPLVFEAALLPDARGPDVIRLRAAVRVLCRGAYDHAPLLADAVADQAVRVAAALRGGGASGAAAGDCAKRQLGVATARTLLSRSFQGKYKYNPKIVWKDSLHSAGIVRALSASLVACSQPGEDAADAARCLAAAVDFLGERGCDALVASGALPILVALIAEPPPLDEIDDDELDVSWDPLDGALKALFVCVWGRPGAPRRARRQAAMAADAMPALERLLASCEQHSTLLSGEREALARGALEALLADE